MRCPDCNKFVAYGEPEIEAMSEELVDDEVQIEIRLMLPCEECGTELKEATFEIAEAVDGSFENCAGGDDAEHDVEVVVENLEPDHRQEGRGRYTKTFYGFQGEVVAQCSCGASCRQQVSDSIQASFMDELI